MKKLLLLLLFIGAIAGVSLHGSQAHAASIAQQNGVSIQSRYSTDFASSSFRQSVDNAAKDGVNYITLVVSVHQDNRFSNDVYIDGNTATDDAIRSGAAYISSKGMGVAIAIHDDPYDGYWRALIDPSNPSQWFTSYGIMLNHYAVLAQSAGINELSIGTEMSSMTNSRYTNSWVIMINSVRGLYKGILTYSAQHAGGYSDAQTLGFWSNLDAIGISAYYSLGNETTKAGMEAQWKNWDQQEISVLANKYNKPVIFTEVGFVSKDGATGDPGSAYGLNTSVNTTLQATAYDALFDYFHSSSYVKGMFLWDWSSDPNAGGSNDGDYTPQNKPAEAIMKNWFTAGGSVVTPPTQPVASVFTVTRTAGASSTTNSARTDTVSVAASTATSDSLVDLEVYDSKNHRVAQTFVEHQSLVPAGSNYSITWTPTYSDTYTIKIGIFTSNWQSTLYWQDAVITTTVSDVVVPPTQPVTPPVTPVTPTPPVTPPTTPTQPTTPSQPVIPPTAINLWWPSDGSAVSGVQPFKAVIDGRDLSTYDMYWQVDNGQLNQLSDNWDGGAHKESLVDLTNWKWNGNHQYVLMFTAKDKSGVVISQKQVTITVN